jgi:hypothetical protein
VQGTAKAAGTLKSQAARPSKHPPIKTLEGKSFLTATILTQQNRSFLAVARVLWAASTHLVGIDGYPE